MQLNIGPDPIFVGVLDSRYSDAIFASAYEAAAHCLEEGQFCTTIENKLVAVVCGRMVRARDCFTRRHMMLALHAILKGEEAGEVFDENITA